MSISILVLSMMVLSCNNENKGLVITTEQLKKMDTLEFQRLEDFDSLQHIQDSLRVK